MRYAGSPYDLISAVNALRTSYGLPPYAVNSILMATAQSHADYMAATGIVSHTGAGGTSVTDRLLAAGYPLAGDLSLGGFRSENITAGSENMSAQAAVNQWSGDSVHLDTMTSPNLSEIGAGVSVNGGRVYYVIDCALPTNNGLPPGAGTSFVSESTVAPGNVIFPVVVVTSNSDGDVIHEVKAGQSLWQIAIAYETKIDEIKRLNNLHDNDIYPGMRLLIKTGVIVSMTSTIDTATFEVITSTASAPTITSTPEFSHEAPSTNTVMGIAIGIVALALIGGGLALRLGNSKKK
jgi:LysM repeat protein